MRLLLLSMISAGLDNPTVPGTVRTDSFGATGAPAEKYGTRASTGSDSPSLAPVRTDNTPLRDSDLATETNKYPPAPSLKPWAPTTTDSNPLTSAPPQ